MRNINIVFLLNFAFSQIVIEANQYNSLNKDTNSEFYKTDENEFYRKEKTDLIYIPGGMMYRNGIGNKNSKLIRVSPFLVYDHKVSNKEYRDVLKIAKKRKLRKQKFLQKLVPDYSGARETLSSYKINESTLTDYFLKNDNSPVVGLTYFQILEFIKLKSEIDGKKYRLMTPDEFDFCVYEVKNVRKDDDIEIVQMEFFDENIKNQIQIINEGIIAENNEIDNKMNKDKKKKKKKKSKKNKNGDVGVGNMNNYAEKKPLKIYRPSDYFNLREKVFKYNSTSPMFTQSYKYKPNGFLIYDLIGNTYEITKDYFNEAEDFNMNKKDEDLSEKLVFTLCGGSCFDYYDNVKIEQKFEDRYDSVRYDRGFRLVIDPSK
jgi:formylglycine-generating enzyme required for sulfatase activity